jgi:hypothetical protein
MAYMVKNPGLLPRLQSICAGDVSKKRLMIENILESAWRSCVQPDPESPEGEAFTAGKCLMMKTIYAYSTQKQMLSLPIQSPLHIFIVPRGFLFLVIFFSLCLGARLRHFQTLLQTSTVEYIYMYSD